MRLVGSVLGQEYAQRGTLAPPRVGPLLSRVFAPGGVAGVDAR